MGLFDLFRKRRNDDCLDGLPPAMRRAFAVLFPKGVSDHNRQLDDLCKHFGDKYKREDLDSNLIFILTGYLITHNNETKAACVCRVLERDRNTMSKSDIEYLYNFALSNHQELAPRLVLQSATDIMSRDGCETDTIPGACGLFGFSPDNPIPAHGVPGIYEYLDHLRDEKANKITYKRAGAVSSRISDYPVDVYIITSPSVSSPVELYI